MVVCHCGCFLKAVALTSVAFIAASFFLGPGWQLQTRRIQLAPASELYGPFTVNNSLDSAQRLFENELIAPESMVIKDGVIYTASFVNGRIFRFKGGKLETIGRVGGDNCQQNPVGDGADQCGQPLGMRMDSSGELVVVDVVKGLYKVSPTTGVITSLVPKSTVVDGKRINLPNDLTISSNGDIFFTDSTVRWSTLRWKGQAGLLDFVEGAPNGRIIHYDSRTKKARTLVERLYLPNGIQLSSNEDSLIFSQSSRCNIMRYHLKGLKKGQLEILLDNLPGFTDNIRPSGRGTYWVALFAVRLPGEESFFERISCPVSRRLIYSCLAFSIQIVEALKTYLSFSIFDVIKHELNELFWNSLMDGSYGLVFEMKEDGTVLRSLHSPKGRVAHISQVTEDKDLLYFASPVNSFLGKIRLYK